MDAIRRQLAEENGKLRRRVGALERELSGARAGADRAHALERELGDVGAELAAARDQVAALAGELRGYRERRAAGKYAGPTALELGKAAREVEAGEEVFHLGHPFLVEGVDAALAGELRSYRESRVTHKHAEQGPLSSDAVAHLRRYVIPVGPDGDTDPEAGE